MSNQTHVSSSDLDATLVSRPGTYGAHHECTVLPERLGHLLNDEHWPIEEVSADTAYGRGPTYDFLRRDWSILLQDSDHDGQERQFNPLHLIIVLR
ncbi:MAG: hypothetical protein AB7P18_33800 [Candidatus Binatia bacterium]